MKTLNRRSLLRGVGGAAIALPYLEIMMPRRVARAEGEGGLSKVGANGRPKRFLQIRHANGHGIGWFDNKVGPDGKLMLGKVMTPMERHKDDLIIIDGLGLRTACHPSQQNAGVDGGHERPHLHIGSCMPIQNRMAGGITIDQAIANGIAGDTKFKSLDTSAVFSSDNYDWQSYTAAQAPIQPLTDPAAVFKKLFSDFQTDPAVFARAQAKRQSILDNVKKNYQGFIATLGGDDQQKVKNHLEGIYQLEASLAKRQIAAGGACAVPAAPAKVEITKCQGGGCQDPNTPLHYEAVGREMSKLIAMAFACDLTRVASLNIHWQMIPSLNIFSATGVHDISHDPENDPNFARGRVSVFHTGYVAEIFDKLKAAQDGPGATVWDNTLFCWTTEIGCGNHNNYRMPYLVAGSAGGYFKTGRILKLTDTFPNATNSQNPLGPGQGELYVSFLNAMGIPATTFGQPEFCRGALPGMV